jgi:hypothetical protein
MNPFNKEIKHKRIIIFSLIGICLISISLTFFLLSMSHTYIGATFVLNDNVWEIQSVDTIGLSGISGIKVGDIPTEINGQSAEDYL